jgi:nitrite reductase/ring-hydroxylating ferredoxin subunit
MTIPRQLVDRDASRLPPFPKGWYFIATRDEVLEAKLIQKMWMGEDVVVWYDEDGQVCVAEAYCPHLGSYLGPDAGGRVCDGRLVCPFHGFAFDAAGQCVETPFAPVPRSARLRVFETRELCGLIFAWWGIGDRQPQWHLPEAEPEQAGWSSIEVETLRFAGHPQETTENAVDLAHLQYVHGYDSVNGDYPVRVDGPYFEARFDFKSPRKFAKFFRFRFDVSSRAQICGLGYSVVEGREHDLGIDFRLWVLATPVDGTLIDPSIVAQVKELKQPARRVMGLSFLPVSWRAPLVNKFMIRQQRQDVLQDVVIWSRKRHVRRPRLCRSDGEIMTYRAYCAQFYPEQEDVLQLPREQARTPQLAAR